MTARRKFPLVEAVEALTENGYKVLTADEWAEVERLKGELAERDEALRAIHDYNCGCDQPGRLDLCVAQPVVVFSVLSARDPQRKPR